MTHGEKIVLALIQMAAPASVVIALGLAPSSDSGEQLTPHEVADALVAALAVAAAAFRMLFAVPPDPKQ